MMRHKQTARRLVSALGRRPDIAFEFYCMASEIVDDFEDWGPVIQADENGHYSESTVIRRLQRARNELLKLMRET